MAGTPVNGPTIKLRAPFPSAETSHREIWRIAFNGSPISTPASSSGSGAMKPRYGAKWYRYTFCSKQPDVANPRKSPDLRLRHGSFWRQRLELSIQGKSVGATDQ